MNKILFFSEIELGPALRAKCDLLGRNMEVFIYEETKGEFWENREETSKYLHLEKRELKNLKNFIIYIYGIKILLKNFFLILKLKKKNKIILEVSDLPLRSGKIKDFFYKIIYNFLILTLVNKLVLTSEYFSKYLIKKPTFIFENLPSDIMIKKLLNIKDRKEVKNKTINIGFVGGLRYFEQLRLLIKFAQENLDINIHFYGQENIIKNKGNFEKEFLQNKKSKIKNIYFHGKFNYEKEIESIYEHLDLIYCVYDASQLNVRVALPNKLYESILSRRIILVAEDTALDKEVKKYNIGYSLPSNLKKYDIFQKKLKYVIENIDNFKYNEIKIEKLLEKIKYEKENLIKFLVD